MLSAVNTAPNTISQKSKKKPVVTKVVTKVHAFSYDISTSTRISTAPLLRDPYEEKMSFVAMSTTAGAGQGLFAKQDTAENVVVAFYNGVRISHALVLLHYPLNDVTIPLMTSLSP